MYQPDIYLYSDNRESEVQDQWVSSERDYTRILKIIAKAEGIE